MTATVPIRIRSSPLTMTSTRTPKTTRLGAEIAEVLPRPQTVQWLHLYLPFFLVTLTNIWNSTQLNAVTVSFIYLFKFIFISFKLLYVTVSFILIIIIIIYFENVPFFHAKPRLVVVPISSLSTYPWTLHFRPSVTYFPQVFLPLPTQFTPPSPYLMLLIIKVKSIIWYPQVNLIIDQSF